MTETLPSTPIYNRIVIPWIVATSYWRTLQQNEIDEWEALLIVIPEEPLKLGEISSGVSDTDFGEWVVSMQRKCWLICEEKGLHFEEGHDHTQRV